MNEWNEEEWTEDEQNNNRNNRNWDRITEIEEELITLSKDENEIVYCLDTAEIARNGCDRARNGCDRARNRCEVARNGCEVARNRCEVASKLYKKILYC